MALNTQTSVVDYLKSTGAASDFSSRKLLAEKSGITGYTGTAEQNTQLLRTLQGSTPTSPTPTSSRVLVSTAPVPGSEVLNSNPLFAGKNTNEFSYAFDSQYGRQPTQPEMQAFVASRSLTPGAPAAPSAPVAPGAGTAAPGAGAPGSTNVNDPTQIMMNMYKAAVANSDKDLLERRNAIMEARFGAQAEPRAAGLERLSPEQMASLRNETDRGLGALLAGTDAALKARKQERETLIASAEKVYQIIKERQAAGKPIEVNPGNDLVDPVTGKVIYRAPEKVAHSAIYNEWQDYILSGGKLGFNDYSNMDANRRRSISTTNITTPTETTEAKIAADASKLVNDLRTGAINWGGAYSTLQTKYPQLSQEAVNGALGGGVPYDPATGKFDSSRAWGNAAIKPYVKP